MMSRGFTWFPNWSVLGEPNIYQNLRDFTRKWGFYLEVLGEEVIISWVNSLLILILMEVVT